MQSYNLADSWVAEYTRNRMWKYFSTGRQYVDALDDIILQVISCSSVNTDCELTRFMLLLLKASDVTHIVDSVITPLEHALVSFDNLHCLITGELEIDASLLRTFIKEQAVLMCCCANKFDIARQVYVRLWAKCTNSLEKDVMKWIDKAVTLKLSQAEISAKSPYTTFLNHVRKFLTIIFQQFSKPYILKMAEKVNSEMQSTKQTKQNVSTTCSNSDVILTIADVRRIASQYCSVEMVDDGCSVLQTQQELEEFEQELAHIRQPNKRSSVSRDAVRVSHNAVGVSHNAVGVSHDTVSGAMSSAVELSDDDNSVCSIQSLRTRFASETRQLNESSTNSSSVTTQKAFHRSTRKHPWTLDEEEKVYLAVRKYGIGNWAAIVKNECLPFRSNVAIKDKWRTMLKQGRVLQLQKKLSR